MAHLITRQLEQIPPFEQDLATCDLTGWSLYQPHYRQCADALSTSTLANQADSFRFVHNERDVVDCPYNALSGVKMRLQVFYFQQWLSGHCVVATFKQVDRDRNCIVFRRRRVARQP